MKFRYYWNNVIIRLRNINKLWLHDEVANKTISRTLTVKEIQEAYCIAKLTSSLSPDGRLKVGSVLFDKRQLYNSSFNAKPAVAIDYDKCIDEKNNCSHPELIHSEIRTLLASPVNIREKELSMLITHAPCVKCASAILDSGIKDIWYCGTHDGNLGVQLLKESNSINVHDYSVLQEELDTYYRTVFIPTVINNVHVFNNFF